MLPPLDARMRDQAPSLDSGSSVGEEEGGSGEGRRRDDATVSSGSGSSDEEGDGGTGKGESALSLGHRRGGSCGAERCCERG